MCKFRRWKTKYREAHDEQCTSTAFAIYESDTHWRRSQIIFTYTLSTIPSGVCVTRHVWCIRVNVGVLKSTLDVFVALKRQIKTTSWTMLRDKTLTREIVNTASSELLINELATLLHSFVANRTFLRISIEKKMYIGF